MADAIGSSATLVGAALESVGYYYQSYLLDTFEHLLVGPIGVLIFAGAAIFALARFALHGKPQLMIWFLIGPAIFAAVIMKRTPTFGSEWLFGKNKRNQEQVDYERRQYLASLKDDIGQDIDSIENAEVSSLFATYNRLVSSVMQTLIKVIHNGREKAKSDALFMLRAELRGLVKSVQATEPEFKQLLHGAFFRSCAAMIDGARDMKDQTKLPEAREDATNAFNCALYQPVELGQSELRYAAGILAADVNLRDLALCSDTQAIATALAASPPVDPAQHLLLRPVNSGTVEQEVQRLKGGFTCPGRAGVQFQNSKCTVSRLPGENPQILSCGAVWNIVYLALFRNALQASIRVRDIGAKNGIEADALTNELLSVKNSFAQTGIQPERGMAERMHVLLQVLASYILRNEMNQISAASFVQHFAKQSSRYSMLEASGESDMAVLERQRLQHIEWQERWNIVTTASNLPYYQGLGLYFLTIAFPFFALLLLIPGRYGGFLMWFFLWLWLKSWDVGFAVVMLLDDILNTLMKPWNSVASIEQDFRLNGYWTDNWSLSDTLFSLRQLDPTFQLSTYYAIIGVCLTAVPVISSYLILGSVKGGATLIAEGVTNFGRSLSQRASAVVGQPATNAERLAGYDQQMSGARSRFAEQFGGIVPETGLDKRVEPLKGLTVSSDSYRGPGDPGGTGADGRNAAEAGGARQQLGTAGGIASGRSYWHEIGDRFGKVTGLNSVSQGTGVNKIIDTLAYGGQTGAKYTQALIGARYTLLKDMINEDLDKAAEAVPFQTYLSTFTSERAKHAAIFGAINVPWAQFQEAGYTREFDNEFAVFKEQLNYGAAPKKAFAEAVGSWGLKFEKLLAPFATLYLSNLEKNGADLWNRGGIVNPRPGLPQIELWRNQVPNGREFLGPRAHYLHGGRDIAGKLGDSVAARADGVVDAVRTGSSNKDASGGFGNFVMIRASGPDPVYLLGAHYDTVKVQAGDKVRAGEQIATMGQTGKATGPHEHFAVIKGTFNPVTSQYEYFYIDPRPYLGGQAVTTRAVPVEASIAALAEADRQKEAAGR